MGDNNKKMKNLFSSSFKKKDIYFYVFVDEMKESKAQTQLTIYDLIKGRIVDMNICKRSY